MSILILCTLLAKENVSFFQFAFYFVSHSSSFIPFFLMTLAIKESEKVIIFHYFCDGNYINEAKLTSSLKPIKLPRIYVFIGIFSR